MFKKNFQLIFVSFLVTGTIMACSSSSWLVTWLGLEINLMSMIPLILFKLNFNSTESAIKYFIPQAMASTILITILMMDLVKSSNLTHLNLNLIILMALGLKSGMAPLHFWFPQVMVFMDWNLCVIMLIWQKIAPFVLLSVFKLNSLTMLLILSSSIAGAIGGINQNNIKLILTYSSIIHGAWMILSATYSISLWAAYFTVYTLISLAIISMTIKNNMDSVTTLLKSKFSKMEKMTIIFNTLSLAGLPPFLGFTAKVAVLVKMINSAPLLILFTLIFSSLTSLYYYLKLFFNFILNNTQMEKFYHNTYTPLKSLNMIFYSILINLMAPALIFLT